MSAHAPSGTVLLKRPPAAAHRPRVALFDVTQLVTQQLVPTLQRAGFDVQPCRTIESGMFEADAVIVEADRGAHMLSGMQVLRGLTGRVCIVGVIGWWSEYEADALRAADALLHIPLRDAELAATVTAIQQRAAHGEPVATR